VLEQGGEATPFALEVALDLAYFQHLVWTIRRLGGADAAAAERLLGNWIAIENLSWAFRYRRLAGLTPEETVNYTLHRAFGAGLDAVLRVATGASVADEAARLGFRVDATASVDEALVELELAAARRRVDAAERSFAGSMFDLGGALAQLTLAEAEARDLVALIEGRVVGLDDAGIASRLVGSPERRGER
jgi:vacuolar-type H+-ATPase subunit C/Vma6